MFGWRRRFSVADDCGIEDDRFEPFIGVPTNFGEEPKAARGFAKSR
jgi:hypothetical protein